MVQIWNSKMNKINVFILQLKTQLLMHIIKINFSSSPFATCLTKLKHFLSCHLALYLTCRLLWRIASVKGPNVNVLRRKCKILFFLMSRYQSSLSQLQACSRCSEQMEVFPLTDYTHIHNVFL